MNFYRIDFLPPISLTRSCSSHVTGCIKIWKFPTAQGAFLMFHVHSMPAIFALLLSKWYQFSLLFSTLSYRFSVETRCSVFLLLPPYFLPKSKYSLFLFYYCVSKNVSLFQPSLFVSQRSIMCDTGSLSAQRVLKHFVAVMMVSNVDWNATWAGTAMLRRHPDDQPSLWSFRCTPSPAPTITAATLLALVQSSMWRTWIPMRLHAPFIRSVKPCPILQMCTFLVCTREAVKKWGSMRPKSSSGSFSSPAQEHGDRIEVVESSENDKNPDVEIRCFNVTA